MPIAKHIKSLVERLNSEIAFYAPEFEQLKSSHGYDLLACLCGLDKYHFQQVGFVSTSLFLNVPTYQPVGWNHHIGLDQALEQLICKKTGLNIKEHFYILGGLICAELAGDFHLGYARQLTDKSSLLFDLAF